uniref:Secreted protein n=1 Tax=Parascaris univalens TaxID=6257 RepID=A0A915BW94_PARUN
MQFVHQYYHQLGDLSNRWWADTRNGFEFNLTNPQTFQDNKAKFHVVPLVRRVLLSAFSQSYSSPYVFLPRHFILMMPNTSTSCSHQ